MKNKILIISFLVIIYAFLIFSVVLKKETISFTERRRLAEFPSLTINTEYSNKVEKYLLDHFPLRDKFRSIKANYNYYVLRKIENNNVILDNDYIYKLDYPTNSKSIDNYIKNFNKLRNLFTDNNNIYMMIVPDKNYYLDNSKYLLIDYDYIYSEIEKLGVNTIDIRNILSINDYYKTDTHWKQENLDKVIKVMTNKLDLPYQKIDYKLNTYSKFYGVYYGESALNIKPEIITYLSNEILDNAKVTYLENKNLNTIYNLDKLNSFDSYEVYLDGASSFIEIENNNSVTSRELVIFRDSFGSSITPLLVNYYKKITVIDNRYINSDNFMKLIEFNNQDILFLNSTLLVNKSNTLKG